MSASGQKRTFEAHGLTASIAGAIQVKMDLARYNGTYSDATGSEPIVVTNDGATLGTEICGVRFHGPDFDRLEALAAGSNSTLSRFTFNNGDLCSCTFDIDIPIPIVVHQLEVQGTLRVNLELGGPASNGGIDRELLKLHLTYADQEISSHATSGWFEDELLDLQRQMPDGIYIKACINCLYSDYSPYGHGLFGCMMCFRNLKTEYLRVQSKQEFWGVHGREDRMVQETFLCPEFARRVPGTGYRG